MNSTVNTAGVRIFRLIWAVSCFVQLQIMWFSKYRLGLSHLSCSISAVKHLSHWGFFSYFICSFVLMQFSAVPQIGSLQLSNLLECFLIKWLFIVRRLSFSDYVSKVNDKQNLFIWCRCFCRLEFKAMVFLLLFDPPE